MTHDPYSPGYNAEIQTKIAPRKEPTTSLNRNGSSRNQWINIREQHEFAITSSLAFTRKACFVEVENTRIGKKFRNLFVLTSIAIVVSLPTIVYLGTVVAAGRVVPNYCNTAGGCPWTV
jgi:hypothetical protein